MDELISRNDAIKWFFRPYSNEEYYSNLDVERALKAIPTVDAAPVIHAKWIDYKDDHQCSACKKHTIFDVYVWKAIQFEFCPWCGAKMDRE